ncbi:MAG: rod shape-determining protein MreC [Acidobacteria bacterium]|nr:rod shape-determining protein MreC [Acidobacteriota bacterium]
MMRRLLAYPTLNLAGLLVVNIVLLSIQIRTPGGHTLIRSWALGMLSPMMLASSYVSAQASEVWENYVSLIGIRRQNRRLQQENLRLRVELQRLRELDQMNLRMEDYRRFQQQFQYETLLAGVVAKSPPFWRSTLLVNAGSSQSVRPDDAVMTPLGIVGRVVGVSLATAEVELITSSGTAVGVVVGEGRVPGIAQGNGDGTLSVRYISNVEPVQAGDLVLTSGTDRIYPPGLAVGRVRSASNGTQIFKEIGLNPIVNLANLQEVLVLTGYDYRP